MTESELISHAVPISNRGIQLTENLDVDQVDKILQPCHFKKINNVVDLFFITNISILSIRSLDDG